MREPLQQEWDVVVAGAGVAGAVAAYRLARRGLRVLLADKADWPRDKVCGGCINAAALRALTRLGLGSAVAAGQTYSGMLLAAGGRQARFSLPAGRALSRRQLDATLAAAAIGAGARFSPATHVRLGDCDADGRWLQLRRGSQSTVVHARVVLACDGLKSQLLDDDVEIGRVSRIGAGGILAAAPDVYPAGTIYMACGDNGYVGLVRVEAGQVNIGAALEPVWIKQCGGPSAAVASILNSAGLPQLDGLDDLRWRGTPRLTRRHGRLGRGRLFALGDAAGYVEPFTGEGMAWAIAGAAAVEPFVLAAVAEWREVLIDAWTARHHALIRNRQRACRGVAHLLRRPTLVAGAVRLAAATPSVAAPLTAWLNRDFKYLQPEAIET
ncbi:MAG TPA: FAD-dependent oxidoreductase [Gammaproteobacteria bacterium]|nr:FAD-dependent oxidoreductase [Gammaproteobacteria bacterium]